MRRKNGRDPNWEMPKGKLIRVADFLPPPEVLAKAPVVVKVTIGLNFKSIQFFKREAAKHRTKYQRLIRKVLDHYVAQHEGK